MTDAFVLCLAVVGPIELRHRNAFRNEVVVAGNADRWHSVIDDEEKCQRETGLSSH
jgi:hypothetical protein